jgi:protein TonB
MPRIAEPGRTNLSATAKLGLLGSLAVHGLLFLAIQSSAHRTRRPEPQAPVEIAVMETQKPPPMPEPLPEEKKPDPPKLAPMHRRNSPPPLPKDAPPPPPNAKDEPPPPNEPPPSDAKPRAPVMIGMSLSSTTVAGGFAAPVGNSLHGSAPSVAPDPQEVKPYSSPSGRYVPPYKVTRMPELIFEVKESYPEEARRLGYEGQVILHVVVDATGLVSQAKVIKGCGHGFDEAALKAVRRFKFKPGRLGDEPVATDINFTYTFELND